MDFTSIFSLDGRVALVTGGSRGIGEACARALVAEGASVVIGDILVNNAGAAWGANFDEFPEDGWDKVMNLNVKTPFFLTQQAKDLLLAAREIFHRYQLVPAAAAVGLRLRLESVMEGVLVSGELEAPVTGSWPLPSSTWS